MATKSKSQRAADAAARAAKAAEARGATPDETTKAAQIAALAEIPAADRQIAAGSSGKAGARITVACKLPGGLLIRNFRMVEQNEQVMGGGMRLVKVAQQIGEPIRLHGTRVPFGEAPKCLIVGGYALTPNVNADDFNHWLKDNADHDAVKNHLVFAQKTTADAQAEAREHKSTRSNLEPLDVRTQTKDPRVPKRITPAVKEDVEYV